MTYDSVFVSNRKNERGQGKRSRLEALNRKNNPQRGMRGIHVGVPRNSKGYLVYVPSMGKIYTSADVYFDENFNSTLAYEQNIFSGYIDLTITEPMPDTDVPYYQTGSSITFGRKHTPGTMQFAQPHTELRRCIENVRWQQTSGGRNKRLLHRRRRQSTTLRQIPWRTTDYLDRIQGLIRTISGSSVKLLPTIGSTVLKH
jgi:hypothetical protein